MALARGAYLIVNVGSSKCMDVKGDSDASKANVIQYTPNNTDGQTWSLFTTKSGVQLNCALSGKSLDVSGTIQNGANVYQFSDKNKKSQRWSIVKYKDHTHTRGGTSYQIYFIKPKSNSKLAIGVKSNSSSNGANVQIQTHSKSNEHQQWIFVPITILKADKVYQLVSCQGKKRCVGVASKATKAGANIQLVSRNQDDNTQLWMADVDTENSVVRFVNAESGLYIGLKGNTASNGRNVVLSKKKDASTYWLPKGSGSWKSNGVRAQVFTLKTQKGDDELYLDVEKTNVRLATASKKADQRFAFRPAVIFGRNLATPGKVTQAKKFHMNKAGLVPISGLSFTSSMKLFQGRFKVRMYSNPQCTKYKDTAWMNLKTGAKTYSGWGDNGDASKTRFGNSKSKANTHSVPLVKFKHKNKNNNKTESRFNLLSVSSNSEGQYSADGTTGYRNGKFNAVAFDIIIDIRGYTSNYKYKGVKGWAAHSSAKSSTIKIRQVPKITPASIDMVIDKNSVGIRAKLANTLGLTPKALRARLIGSNGFPISSWVTVSNKNVAEFYFDGIGNLTRLPNNNESVKLEFNATFKDDVVVENTVSYVYSAPSTNSFTVSTSSTTDGSGIVNASMDKADSMCCLMHVDDIDGERLVRIPTISTDSNRGYFAIPVPLNKSVVLDFYKKDANSSTKYKTTKTVTVDSHFSIWNWTEPGTTVIQTAVLITNIDAPPAQTRNFQASVQTASPTGRNWPVAFADISLTADVSVSGTAVDGSGGVSIVTSEEIPVFADLAHLGKLARLAGKGIHPIYRTPYGDWYQVVISGVQLDKQSFGYSSVTITQNVVED